MSDNIFSGFFVPSPELRCIATGHPACVFRNRKEYKVSETARINVKDEQKQMNQHLMHQVAWKQTQMAMDSLLDDPIPSYVLHDTIMEDEMSWKPSAKNTVLSTFHEDRSVFIHAAGKNLSQLILREEQFTATHCRSSMQQGFTLDVGTGASITSLQVFSQSEWGSSTHILFQSGSEIHHARTLGLDTELPPDGIFHQCDRFSHTGLILEPLQKWIISDNIASMTTSASSGFGNFFNSALISKRGQLHLWSAEKGFKPFGSEAVIRCEDHLPIEIKASIHPSLYHIAHGKGLFCKDIRMRGLASIDKTFENNITSMITFPFSNSSCSGATYLGVSIDGATPMIQIFDNRNCNLSCAQKYIPESHESLSVTQVSDCFPSNLASKEFNTCLLLGHSSRSRQLMVHTVSSRGDIVDRGTSNNSNNSMTDLERKWQIISQASTFGGRKAALNWDISAYPTIDHNQVALVGASILPCPKRVSRVDKGTVEPFVRKMQIDQILNRESHKGIKAEELEEIQEYVPYNAVLIHQTSIGDVYLQHLAIDQPENPTFCQRKLFDVPVQLGLPIGNVCHGGVPQTMIKGYRPSGGTRLEDTVFDVDKSHIMYPMPSSSFTQLIPEDSLRGFDVIKVSSSDFRGDLPKLKKGQSKVVKVNYIPVISDYMEAYDKIHQNYGLLLDALEKYPHTLWEIWRILCNELTVNIYHEELLKVLRNLPGIVEEYDIIRNIQSYDNVDVRKLRRHEGALISKYIDANTTNEDATQIPQSEIIESQNPIKKHRTEKCTCNREIMASKMTAMMTKPNNYSIRDGIAPCCSNSCIIGHCIKFRFKDTIEIAAKSTCCASQIFPSYASDVDMNILGCLNSEWLSATQGDSI